MDENRPASRWYLLQCKPQQQSRAMENLANQQFHCFNPSHPVRRRYRRRLLTRREPLFPGYVFILLDRNTDWRALMSTRGVSRVVSFNHRPVPVSEEVVEALWRRCQQADEEAPAPLFQPGQRVMVTEGCFRHVEAIVQASHGDERVVLLMQLMHSPQQVEMPASQLVPA